jgi:hypothetical protein
MQRSLLSGAWNCRANTSAVAFRQSVDYTVGRKVKSPPATFKRCTVSPARWLQMRVARIRQLS